MKQGKYRITANRCIAYKVWRMDLEGDTSALDKAGKFVDIAVEGFFLRRPLAATCWDEKGFSVIYKKVGKGTEALSRMVLGQELDILTGLGNGFNTSACSRKALIVCGGLGASPVFSLAKELISEGKQVTLIQGFNTKYDIILNSEFKDLGIQPAVVTMDGSAGMKGLVTDAIDAIDPDYDYFYTCGPAVMMKAVCEKLEGPGEASLEERMGCGCGICYGCTCHTKSGAKRVCADGPVFKKEDIIW